MEFNTTTFILEIINFLILLWILQRLFYKPLLAMIAKRKQFIDDSLADAKKLHQEADDLRALYENRQNLWEQEKKAAFSELQRQIDFERTAQLEKLQADLEQERQIAKVTLSRQQLDFQHQTEKQALFNGARFAGMLLGKSAGPELEARLYNLLLEGLSGLPKTNKFLLQIPKSEKELTIKVTSAYPLQLKQCEQLEQKLTALINTPITCQYHQDPELLAGLRIDVGAWVLHANLKHELTGFAEIANESD